MEKTNHEINILFTVNSTEVINSKLKFLVVIYLFTCLFGLFHL